MFCPRLPKFFVNYAKASSYPEPLRSYWYWWRNTSLWRAKQLSERKFQPRDIVCTLQMTRFELTIIVTINGALTNLTRCQQFKPVVSKLVTYNQQNALTLVMAPSHFSAHVEWAASLIFSGEAQMFLLIVSAVPVRHLMYLVFSASADGTLC